MTKNFSMWGVPHLEKFFFIVILRYLCFVILTIFIVISNIFIVISSEARNLILRNAMHFFHAVFAQCHSEPKAKNLETPRFARGDTVECSG